jgi:hypothetical protein
MSHTYTVLENLGNRYLSSECADIEDEILYLLARQSIKIRKHYQKSDNHK